MKDITIYHNPRCSKSRQTLALIEEKTDSVEVVKYLDTGFSAELLEALLGKLGISARDLLRKGEADYKEQGLSDLSLNESDLIAAMVKFPKLVERPIVVKSEQAVLGRPPENVLALLD